MYVRTRVYVCMYVCMYAYDYVHIVKLQICILCNFSKLVFEKKFFNLILSFPSIVVVSALQGVNLCGSCFCKEEFPIIFYMNYSGTSE